jgi:hypothetical protein
MLTGASVNDTTGSSRSETVHPELISLVNKVKEGAAIEEERWTETDARTMLATLNSLWMEAKGNGMPTLFVPPLTNADIIKGFTGENLSIQLVDLASSKNFDVAIAAAKLLRSITVNRVY